MPRPCEPNNGLSTKRGLGRSASSRALPRRHRPSTARSAESAPRRGRAEGWSSTCRRNARWRLASFQTSTPSCRERMQDAEPLRHRLERAAGDGADERPRRARRRRSRGATGRRAAGVEPQVATGAVVDSAPRRRRPAASAPPRAGPPSLSMRTRGITGRAASGLRRSGLIRGSWPSIVASRAPARKVSPLSIAVTITSAGLNSSGSMA